MDNTPSSKHVFISYSHADVRMMNRIRKALESMGIRVWTDEGLVPGTESWKTTIEASIRDALGVIAILSPSAKQSIWVERELEYASIHGIRIFPVLVQGEPVEAIPIELINAQWLDVRNETNLPTQMQRLALALLGKPVAREVDPTNPGPVPVSTQPLPKPGKRPALLFLFLVGACLLFVATLTILLGSEIIQRLINNPGPFTLTDGPPGGNAGPTDPSPSDGTACIVTITNPFTPLMSEPDPTSQQLIQVPPGDYTMLDYTQATFAGREQGWFMIEAEGRTGWVEDNIIFIDGKTRACP